MTDEEKRLVIAEAIAATHVREGWVFSPDNSVPESAQVYAVYDGAEILGAGLTASHVPELVARAKMPIVFYIPEPR
jgi:enterochelin esterase-like enzyme